MKIYYQTGQWQEQHIDCYQVKQGVQKVSIHARIEDILAESQHESDSVFLVDETYFDLVSCPVEWTFYEPLSLLTLEKLIEMKVKSFKKDHHVRGEMLVYDITYIMIDHEESSYILGKTGHIQFQLSLFFIKPSLLVLCPTLTEKSLWPKIYPASYFTVQFITKSLKKENFWILTISEHQSRFIHINHGWYETIESLDRWYQHIKEMCKKNNILSYFYKSDDELQANPVAYTIMEQSMKFYNKMLIERLANYCDKEEDSIVIAPQLEHHVFRESFTHTYQQLINGYVVPFSITKSLQQYHRTRQPHELDVLTCLNVLHT